VAAVLDPPPAPAAPPDLSDLEIQDEIGRGGMGVVYRARQVSLDRTVAVKVLAPERAADPAFAERFVREARAMAKLSHPRVVAVYEARREGDRVYLVMEYVAGQTLRDRIRAGAVTVADALRLIPQLCDALQYAHDRGVVHRDVKPENVLLDAAGNLKLTDFGLAKGGPGDFTLTGSGERMGTARYMAPEQWADAAAVDHRADIYSLGVLLYELLTGAPPTPQFAPPSAVAGTDPRLDRVVSRSLRDAPADRYQRAAEVKDDVVRITTPRPRWPAAAVVAGLAAAVAAGVLIGRPPRPPEPPPAPPGAGQPAPSRPPLPPAPAGPPTPTDVLTSPDWEWATPENLGPGVNTAFTEQSPCLSADGLTLWFTSNRPGGRGENDLWVCRRPHPGAAFGAAENLGPGVNTAGVEDAPCVTPDGRTMAFAGTRGGKKYSEIWLARRADPAAGWGAPESAGPGVNARADQYRPWLSADGLTLTFARSTAQTDSVMVSTRPTAGAPFGPAQPYGVASDRLAVSGPAFSADGRTLLLNRFDRAYRGNLLWLARIDDPARPFLRLTSFGPVVNGPHTDTNPAPSADGRLVVFASTRPGGHGGDDLWLTRRVPRRP
jgi:hypothetical protein